MYKACNYFSFLSKRVPSYFQENSGHARSLPVSTGQPPCVPKRPQFQSFPWVWAGCRWLSSPKPSTLSIHHQLINIPSSSAVISPGEEQEREAGDPAENLLQDNRWDPTQLYSEGCRRILRQGEELPARLPFPAERCFSQSRQDDQVSQRSAQLIFSQDHSYW